MFAIADESFQNPKIFVFKKADLYAGAVSPSTTVFTDVTGAGAPQPAATYSSSLATLYLARHWAGSVGDVGFESGYLRVSSITGTVIPSYSAFGAFVETPNPWEEQPPGFNDFAPQLGTADKIQNSDSRLLNVVYRNGSLWAAQNAFLPIVTPTRTAAQWWQFTPAGTVQQFGRVDDATGAVFYAFPSIAVNSQGDALLGFSTFSATQFASAGYAVRVGGDAPSTMRDPVLLKAGEATYYKILTGTRNRWGDYSATVVDPSMMMGIVS